LGDVPHPLTIGKDKLRELPSQLEPEEIRPFKGNPKFSLRPPNHPLIPGLADDEPFQLHFGDLLPPRFDLLNQPFGGPLAPSVSPEKSEL
jgi:hypothetical protein